MKVSIVLFGLVCMSMAFACEAKTAKIQALEGITQAPTFLDIQKVGFSKKLQVVVGYEAENCFAGEDDNCDRTFQSGKIEGLTVQGREVYYNGTYCGKLRTFGAAQLSDSCQVEVQKITSCTQYVNGSDCTNASTTYSVNLSVTAE